MAAKKKSGRTYIRMGPDVHTRLAKTAKAVGMDINGLMNLSIRTTLPQYELLAQADQTGDPQKKASVLRLIHALTQFSTALMAQTDLVARGTADPEGKAALERLIDVMYEFATAITSIENARRKKTSRRQATKKNRNRKPRGAPNPQQRANNPPNRKTGVNNNDNGTRRSRQWQRRATAQRHLASNHATAVKKPKATEPDIHPLDAEQARTFLVATEADRVHALYVLALDTGMRQGELFGLHWPEIDFASGVVTIKYSLEERDNSVHRLKEPKTKSSRRRIEVTPAALAALNRHRQRQLADGHYREDGPVLVDTEGNWLRKSNVRRRSFDRALKRAGLPPIRFHDLRHTAATLMLLSGINIKAVAATLGHKKASTTLDIYMHKLPLMDKERVNAMQRILAAG